jgi:hypothetical protein
LAEAKDWAVEQVAQQVPHKYQIQLHPLADQDRVADLAVKAVVEQLVLVVLTQAPQVVQEVQELVTASLVVQ